MGGEPLRKLRDYSIECDEVEDPQDGYTLVRRKRLC